jgi:hypothetical protein
MPSQVYRYRFLPTVEVADIEAALVLAILSIEHLHGEAAARLDARYYLDVDERRCVIDATSPIGVELNKLFAGSITRDAGPDAFAVERVSAVREAIPAAT